MNNRDPQIGDLVMLMREEIIVLPPKPKRGRPSKKNPLNIQTQSRWHDDAVGIVISGPHQGISSDGEDYWHEWKVQRLEDNSFRVITRGSPWRAGGAAFRFIDEPQKEIQNGSN